MSHAVLSHAAAHFAAPEAHLAPPPGTPVVEVSRGGAVAADLPCRRCGDNLRDLPVHSRCRQCGAFVGLSLYGELLKYGHPRWVRRLSRGAGTAAWGVALTVVAVLADATLGGRAGAWAAGIAGAAAGVTTLIAAWRLTPPDPSGQLEVALPSHRRLIRAGVFAGFLGRLAPCAALVAPPTPWTPWLPHAALAAALAGVAAHLLLFDQLRQLALRVPALALAGRTRLLRWGYCGALAAVTVLGLAPVSTGAFARLLAHALIVSLLATVAYGAASAAMLSRLRRVLGIQADYAQGIAARTAASAA
jgi:hypothetical protein